MEKAETKTELDNKELIKSLLGNETVLNFTKKSGLGRLTIGQEITANNLGITAKQDSIMMISLDAVKAIVTNAEINREKHTVLSIGQLRELLSIIPKQFDEGSLIIQKKENHPAFLKIGNDVIVLAPRIME